MKKSNPTILIIVGITGDLSVRKLLPALAALHARSALPEHFHLVGITRQGSVVAPESIDALDSTIVQMDIGNSDEYQRLATVIDSIEQSWGETAQHLLYLSVPPTVALSVIEHIASIPITTLLLEKPFGTDSASADSLIQNIEIYFPEERVRLVDHYTAKEVATDIAHFRDHRLINNTKKIAHIEVVASESLGVEGRGNFYEQTGALRDIVQNHLLQLLALTLGGATARAKVVALAQLSVVSAKRGQYEGYRTEVGNPGSMTETAVSLTIASSDPLYVDVPIVLATGKALGTKETRVSIIYMDGTSDVFVDTTPHTTYERVFTAAIASDPTLFVTPEEVLESWRIVTPAQDAWKRGGDDLVLYPKGTDIKDFL